MAVSRVLCAGNTGGIAKPKHEGNAAKERGNLAWHKLTAINSEGRTIYISSFGHEKCY